MRWAALCALLTWGVGSAAGPAAVGAASLDWNKTFGDVQGALHLQASYPDAAGHLQALEMWRSAAGQVVRKAGQAELRLTPAPDGEDLYQLRDPVKQVAYNVHRTNLYRLGVMTDRWSVQHLLDRPAAGTGATLRDLGKAERTGAGPCHWYSLTVTGKQALNICWAAGLGVPLRLMAGGREVLNVSRVETGAAVTLPSLKLPAGWHEFDADDDLSPD